MNLKPSEKTKKTITSIFGIVAGAYGSMGAEVAFALLDFLASREKLTDEQKAQLQAEIDDYIARIGRLDAEIAEDRAKGLTS